MMCGVIFDWLLCILPSTCRTFSLSMIHFSFKTTRLADVPLTDQLWFRVPPLAAALGDWQALSSGQRDPVQSRHPPGRRQGLSLHPVSPSCSSHPAAAQAGPGRAAPRRSLTQFWRLDPTEHFWGVLKKPPRFSPEGLKFGLKGKLLDSIYAPHS